MKRNFVFSKGEYYHIYSRGVDKRQLFFDTSDYNRFVKLLYVANNTKTIHLSDDLKWQGRSLTSYPRERSLVAIGAWCLMPNHLHILIKEIVENGISLFMKKLLTSFSMYFNIKNQRSGTLFENRFKARRVEFDIDLKYQLSYIHLNSIGTIDSGWKRKNITNLVRAKNLIANYPYSSCLDYMGLEREEKLILTPEAFPSYFSDRFEFMKELDFWMNFSNGKDGP